MPENSSSESTRDLERRTSSLFAILANLYGPDKLVLKARKMGVLKLIRSGRVGDRLLALRRLVFEDAAMERTPAREDCELVLEEIEEELSSIVAQRSVEMDINAKVADKLRKHHLEYLGDLRREALKEQLGPETAASRKKLAQLEELESHGLDSSALGVIRPSCLAEVVGQERAIQSLLAKIGTHYPQHVILYGPPGVGKTTVARLVLDYVKQLGKHSFAADAPFVEVDATTLRWDWREITNPLLGSVHDPIYQGSKRELAEDGIPEPKLGLVTKAHGGVLFLDEIGELDIMLLNKLLKVLEDKRIVFESSYFDEDDPRVPEYIKHLFTVGAPADFILVGATTRQPEDIPMAIRSRCSEVFFEPLTTSDICQIVEQAAERIGLTLGDGVAAKISRYTVEGRKAVQILTDVYGLLSSQDREPLVTQEVLDTSIRLNRLTDAITVTAGDEPEIGHIFGIGVAGFLGTCLELEATVFAARESGKGAWRFNEAAGNMARDSVFNAGSVVRKLLNKDLADYDVHVNVVGGGKIDGPSAGLAVTLALYSALAEKPIRADMAVTGEVSIRGKVKPVGGIPEKLYGAMQAGMRLVLVPWDNRAEIPPDLPEELKIVPVRSVEEAIAYLSAD